MVAPALLGAAAADEFAHLLVNPHFFSFELIEVGDVSVNAEKIAIFQVFLRGPADSSSSPDWSSPEQIEAVISFWDFFNVFEGRQR